MDIPSLSMGMSQSQISTDISCALFSMAKKSMIQSGEQIVNLIETGGLELSVNPNVGSNIDIKL